MQIIEIVLYGAETRKRVLPLRAGKVNIITGGSATGKSALIEIVEYCLGADKCRVPEGIIRETVKWYGLRIQFPNEQMFIARENPPSHAESTNRCLLIQGQTVQSPAGGALKPNTTIDAIVTLLGNKIGIAPTLTTPPSGHTRDPLAATIRHALIFCFQQQDEIATKSTLFHKQSDSFVRQATQDTLPYFLGAIKEDQLALEQELARAKRDLRRAQVALKERDQIKGDGIQKAISLLSEARAVGILASGDTPSSFDDVVTLLKTATQWTPEAVQFPTSDRLTQLQEEVRVVQSEFSAKIEALSAAKTYAKEAVGFETEAQHQALRLESIGLFSINVNSDPACPICGVRLQGQVPKAKAIQHSLSQIKSSLQTVARERPKLRQYIETLEREREALQQKLNEKNQSIEGILAEEQQARLSRDLNVRRGRVAGRIGLWLESVTVEDESAHLRDDVLKAAGIVRQLEKQLDDSAEKDRLTSILNRLGIEMTNNAKFLKLEHGENPVRFDVHKLTVVADRPMRPITLDQMGSGENWVGYHLITHLALHQHFCRNTRPVPRFLFLDQPSQVYYPTERDAQLQGSTTNLPDEDREALLQMFKLLFKTVESLESGFQIIVTDHADLTDSQFQSAIVERWRRGHQEALIPEDWNTPPSR